MNPVIAAVQMDRQHWGGRGGGKFQGLRTNVGSPRDVLWAWDLVRKGSLSSGIRYILQARCKRSWKRRSNLNSQEVHTLLGFPKPASQSFRQQIVPSLFFFGCAVHAEGNLRQTTKGTVRNVNHGTTTSSELIAKVPLFPFRSVTMGFSILYPH
ncbi:hypothetical protein BDD12DRAFT_241215 [Trichophaea hybrida]|nr:hypothetical protein BDD12DRAFT_241215 [Trichophaea hybrida]